jgi:hypothetical protein
MFRIRCCFLAMILAQPLLCQLPTIQKGPEDQLRQSIAETHRAFMAAHPELERTLDTAPPEVLRQQIAESRQLAIANMAANAEFYTYLIQQTVSEISGLSGGGGVNPAQLTRQMQADIARRKQLESDVQNAQNRAKEIGARQAGATGRERERLTLDLEAANEQARLLAEIKVKVEEEMSNLQLSLDQTEREKDTRNKLADLKRSEVDKYRRLKANWELGRAKYIQYFNALDAYVDSREQKKRPDGKK